MNLTSQRDPLVNSRFSPTYLSTLIVDPLRYMFRNYSENYKWDVDKEKTGIEIDTINNFHKVAIGFKPRIVVGRGQYSINPTGLSDSLSSGSPFRETLGLRDEKYMAMIQGTSQIMIEARQEGVCEDILDEVSHFVFWSSISICESQGFKSFGRPLVISPCTPSREDTEIFQTTINIPWTKEERWSLKTDGVDLKRFILTLNNS